MRRLAAELYRPKVARLVVLGEAPPPERYLYFGDSLFFRYLRQAFERCEPSLGRLEIGEFLALLRESGVWCTAVCATPQRATKGGADDVEPCLEEFRQRWKRQSVDTEAMVVVSPKRLLSQLPEWLTESHQTAGVPPPGQWKAHREAFLRDMGGIVAREFGAASLRESASRIDSDDARLDFEIVRACAEGAPDNEILRMLKGHPREAALNAAWNGV